MQARQVGSRPQLRLGPRPLPLHLGTALMTWATLRPEPLAASIGRAVGRPSIRSALPHVRGQVALAIYAIGTAHAIMVSVMALTPVHMQDHGSTLRIIGITISLHIAGMFARLSLTEEQIIMIGFLVAGLIIGALARLIKPGKPDLGILATLGLGLVGSLIGGVIASFFGTGSIWELNILGFVLAVVAAVLLVGGAEALTSKSGPKQLR